uniref:Transducer of regulated CREB activity N-terminal domain-containing protein n=1 Tax=Anopheles merus TaxID=30066 RepID=A0A182V8Z8_ANOME
MLFVWSFAAAGRLRVTSPSALCALLALANERRATPCRLKIASSAVEKVLGSSTARCGTGPNMTNPRKYRDKIKIQEEKMKLQQQEFERTMLEVSPIFDRRVNGANQCS